MKSLLARRELSGPLGKLESIHAKNVENISMKTLGQLVGELTNDYLQPTLLKSGEISQQDQNSSDETNSHWFSLKFSIAISPEGHAEISQQLRELVTLRNILVHHFIERFDLMSEPGCLDADLYLQDCYEKIDNHYLTLKRWAETMDEARGHAAALITSPEFWKSTERD